MQPTDPPPRPCGCACNAGGWCGGCGHAGCRLQRPSAASRPAQPLPATPAADDAPAASPRRTTLAEREADAVFIIKPKDAE